MPTLRSTRRNLRARGGEFIIADRWKRTWVVPVQDHAAIGRLRDVALGISPRASAVSPLTRSSAIQDSMLRAAAVRRDEGPSDGFEIDDEIEFGRLLDWDVGRLRPAQNLADQLGGTPEEMSKCSNVATVWAAAPCNRHSNTGAGTDSYNARRSFRPRARHNDDQAVCRDGWSHGLPVGLAAGRCGQPRGGLQ